jgi:cysteine desulfurase family protein
MVFFIMLRDGCILIRRQTMIYFDQAASSFPKPKEVAQAVYEAIHDYGANPGRGGHALAKRAGDKIYETRAAIAKFFGLRDPKRVVFFQNATGALNQGIKGLDWKMGDHVLTTSYEHNSVRRPLEYLKKHHGVEISYMTPTDNGGISQDEIKSHIKAETKLIVVNHGSNLTGMILPLEKLSTVAKEHNILLMVDASQTAGILPIHMEEMGIDILAFAGHKGLMGPQGTGALLVREGIQLMPILHGGTGRFSEDADQPEDWPERLESGTLNTPGIAGLLAGLQEVEEITIKKIYQHERALTHYCLEKLQAIQGVKVFGPSWAIPRLAVIAFIIEGIDSHEVAMVLDQHYQIAVRAGIHCTPLAHEAVGSIETGAVRVSFGIYNTKQEIDQFIKAIEEIKMGFLG